MKTQHTSAPWVQNKLDSTLILSDKYAFSIAIANYDTEEHSAFPPHEEAKANARLIAAAPEMFDALENLLNLVKTDIEMTHCEVTAKGKKAILAAQKAIEKAKGGRE